MKTLFTTLLMAVGLHGAHAAFMSNAYTTNSGVIADQHTTNVVALAMPSLVNTGLLSSAGALVVTNYRQYADQNGAAFIAQNNAIIEAEGYTDNSFLINPYNWINTAATNHITKFDTNVVTSISLGTGLSGSTSLDANGYHVTIQATGTNNTSITNLNPTVLAQAGGVTTNNVGTYADPPGAATGATNNPAIVRTDNLRYTMALTNFNAFDTNGAALSSTNQGNIRFTNNPVVGSFVLGTNLVLNAVTTNSRGEITYTISSAAAGGGSVGVFQPAATNLYQWAGLSTNQIVINTNIVAQIIGGPDITLTAVTNAGLISVTISYSGDLTPQHGSQSLTNWSTVTTNMYLANTNLVTKITAGTGMTVTATTNQFGINYTVTQTTSPAVVRAGSFTAVAGGSGSVVFSSTMGSTPVIAIAPTDWGNSATGRSFVIITAVSATGFSWSDANDTSGVNKTIYYIATLPQ